MKPTLLIVDDSRVSRIMIKTRVLQLYPEWDVFEAASGDLAVKMLAEQAVDFITMDVNMPGISGFEAVEQIKAIRPSARIAMLTANVQESSREQASALNVTFIPKPVTDASIRQALAYFTTGQ